MGTGLYGVAGLNVMWVVAMEQRSGPDNALIPHLQWEDWIAMGLQKKSDLVISYQNAQVIVVPFHMLQRKD